MRFFSALSAGAGVTAFAALSAVAAPAPAVAQAAPGAGVLDTIIQPGHRDYARYTTPGMCLAAVTGINTLAHRTVAYRATVDTSAAHVTAPEREPLVDSAVAAARACGSKFTPENVPSAELANLVLLAFAANDDARAMAVAARWVQTTQPRTATDSAWALFDVFMLLTRTQPFRRATADTVLARVAAFGPTARLPRMYAVSWALSDAEKRFELAEVERRAFDYYTADAGLTPADRDQRLRMYLGGQYRAVMGWAPGVALNRATAAGKPHELAQLAATLKARTGATWTLGDDFWNRILQQVTTTYRVTTPLPATYWFGTHGEHRWPVPGKVSVFLQADVATEPMLAILRRVMAKYGDTLAVTLLYTTKGYFHDSGPLKPAEEAEAVRKYYLDDLKLPVTLAVADVPMQQLPDGRRFPGKAAYETQEGYYFDYSALHIKAGGVGKVAHSLMVVDPAGRTVWAGMPLGFQSEVEAYIDRALGRTPAASPATAPAASDGVR